jgi:hypothetical protein
MSAGWLTSCDVSAVILAVIVIMWAVVLVPMWLRRHDAATESRSVDRFSTAMRVLSRRGGSPDRRYVLMPKRESRATVHVSGASAPHRRPTHTRATQSRATQSRPTQSRPSHGRPSLAVRRRRTLLGLVGIAFLTVLLALAGVIGWPLQLVVDLIVAAFVVHLRTQAKRAAAVSRQRRRAAAAPAEAIGAAASAPASAAAAGRRPMPATSRGQAPATIEPDTAPIPAVEPAAATGTDDRWDPVPVPPPTYTMKPRAPQRWTYAPPTQPGEPGALVAEPHPEPEPVEVAEVAEVGELDGILEHRWAVND